MLDRLDPVFKSFQKYDVKYLVIGGIAAIVHGVPRNTFDLDILIEPTRENADRVLTALLEAGLGTATLTNPEELLKHEVTIFRDFVQVDVQTRTPGIEFGPAWTRRTMVDFEGQTLSVVCLEDLIASKKAAGRKIDLEDVQLLESDKP
jgi:predicted nucleotidyltransferase